MAITTMTEFDAKLAIRLLELAADKFSNHGCNDFNLVREFGLTPIDLVELDLKLHTENGDPEEHDPNVIREYQADWVLMLHAARTIRKVYKLPDEKDD